MTGRETGDPEARALRRGLTVGLVFLSLPVAMAIGNGQWGKAVGVFVVGLSGITLVLGRRAYRWLTRTRRPD